MTPFEGYALVFGALLVGGLVVVVRTLVRAFLGPRRRGRPGRPHGPGRSEAAPRPSREVLHERYARGEIGPEEYHDGLRRLDDEQT